jgi:hypothetical protein
MKTTLLVGSGASTVSPAGSRHDTPAGTHRVVVIQDMSAGVTSDQNVPKVGLDYPLPAQKWLSCNIPGCEARNRENTEVCIAFMHRKSRKFSRF